MKKILRDHGNILHWAGAHHLFPVRGPGGDADVSFATHGELEGRTPIGWNNFFPAIEGARKVVLADDDAGVLTVLPETAAYDAIRDPV